VVGLGWAGSPEEDVFNLTQDGGVSPDLAYTAQYYYNFTEHLALGAHVFGYQDKLEGYTLDFGGGPVPVTFDLVNVNFGGRVRWTFLRGRFEPYALIGFGVAGGNVENQFTGSLQYTGMHFLGGFGVTLTVGSFLGLSLETIGSTAFGDWAERPFESSWSDEFDPSLYGILVAASLRWG
jgi:hypothetical protein